MHSRFALTNYDSSILMDVKVLRDHFGERLFDSLAPGLAMSCVWTGLQSSKKRKGSMSMSQAFAEGLIEHEVRRNLERSGVISDADDLTMSEFTSRCLSIEDIENLAGQTIVINGQKFMIKTAPAHKLYSVWAQRFSSAYGFEDAYSEVVRHYHGDDARIELKFGSAFTLIYPGDGRGRPDAKFHNYECSVEASLNLDIATLTALTSSGYPDDIIWEIE